jgi:hypothetical protein
VAYLLKEKTVEAEKQTLLTNSSERTFISRQQFCEHIPAAKNKHTTIEVLLETVFSTRSVQTGCKEDNWSNRESSVQESVKKSSVGMEPQSREDLSE